MPKDLSRPSVPIDQFYTSIHLRMLRRDTARPRLRPTIREFEETLRLKSIPNSGTALDAGCGGTAAVALACSRYGFTRVCAMDVNETSLQSARALTDNWRDPIFLSRASVLCMPFPDAAFDFAACLGVAHHTAEPGRAIEELSRVLKSKGLLYFSVYCFADSVFEIVVRLLRFLGSHIPARAFHSLAERSQFVNNFILDHAYVPILWLFHAEEVRTLLIRNRFEVLAEWASNMDPFAGFGSLGRCLTGDGLLRVWLCRKM